MKIEGNILKMKSQLKKLVQYYLPIGDQLLPMNPLIGKKISITYSGTINCIATGEKIKKSFGQGYSYAAHNALARCDMCIVKPEKCHYHLGTCREPLWGERHCMIDHIIYLANTGDVKVGITRHTQIPTRWVDQGATQALAFLKVTSRRDAGLLEVELKKFIGDKTNWRKMLKTEPQQVDLISIKSDLIKKSKKIRQELSAEELDEKSQVINYPVEQYPAKIQALNLDKEPKIEGTLLGIKGQYLLFDVGVINLRKYQGYKLKFQVSAV